jgi:hypothetical protein
MTCYLGIGQALQSQKNFDAILLCSSRRHSALMIAYAMAALPINIVQWMYRAMLALVLMLPVIGFALTMCVASGVLPAPALAPGSLVLLCGCAAGLTVLYLFASDWIKKCWRIHQRRGRRHLNELRDSDSGCGDSHDETRANLISAVRAVFANSLHPDYIPAKGMDDGECPICMESFAGDEGDGGSMVKVLCYTTVVDNDIEVGHVRLAIQKPCLTRCKTCKKVMHATCMCQSIVTSVYDDRALPHACPMCRTAFS